MELAIGRTKHYVFVMNINNNVKNKRNNYIGYYQRSCIIYNKLAPGAISHHKTRLADVAIYYVTYIMLFAAASSFFI